MRGVVLGYCWLHSGLDIFCTKNGVGEVREEREIFRLRNTGKYDRRGQDVDMQTICA